MASDMRVRLLIAAALLPLLGLLFGADSEPLRSGLLVTGGVCLLASLIGYATQRE